MFTTSLSGSERTDIIGIYTSIIICYKQQPNVVNSAQSMYGWAILPLISRSAYFGCCAKQFNSSRERERAKPNIAIVVSCNQIFLTVQHP